MSFSSNMKFINPRITKLSVPTRQKDSKLKVPSPGLEQV